MVGLRTTEHPSNNAKSSATQPTFLHTLGGLNLESTPFTRPKPLLLLAYLTLEGAQSRRHIAELFWSEASDHMKSLSVALARLRQDAPGTIAADNNKVWSTVRSDVGELLEHLDKHNLEKALELYKGAFLEGFYLAELGVELEEWVYKTREYIAGRVRGVILELAEKKASGGDFAKAASYSEKAYRLTGASEPEVNDLERIYHLLLAGNSSKAVELRVELETFGINVLLSSEAAQQKLRKLAPKPKQQSFPTRATSFVGRDVERTEIATLLAEPNCQLLTLVGEAGVGKTRLALQIAYEKQKLETFKDGVYFVSLESVNLPSLIATQLATTLGLELQTEQPFEEIARAIAEQNMLIVLDNLEHLLEGVHQLSFLVKSCNNLKLLITSRERLRLEEEHVFVLSGLAFPTGDVTLGQAAECEAVSLFVQRAKQMRGEFLLDNETLPDVLQICKLVEGLPLGLELAATWLRMLSCQDIVVEIENNLDFLTTTTQNIPARHQSLRAVFESSWKLLNAKEQIVLAQLSVFRGGFRREAASEVAGATIPLLASLLDKSLLRVTNEGRYSLHPLVRQFAEEKLTDAEATKIKHSSYYTHLIKQCNTKLNGRNQKEALRVIGEELANIRAACQWAASSKEVTALQTFTEPLLVYFGTGHQPQEGLELCMSLHKTLEGQQIHSADLETARASLACQLGRYDEAQTLAERGLALVRSDKVTTRALNILGIIALQTEKLEQAQNYWEVALSLATEQRDKQGAARYLGNLALVERARGQYCRAIELLNEALAICREEGLWLYAVRQLNSLGNVYLHLNQLDEAKKIISEGLQLARDMDMQDMIPYFLNNLANIAREQKDYQGAYQFFLEDLHLSQTMGDTWHESGVLTDVGKVLIAMGRLEEAHGYFMQALELAHRINVSYAVFYALTGIAALKAAKGRVEEAANMLVSVINAPDITAQPQREAQRVLESLPGSSKEKALPLPVSMLVESLLNQQFVMATREGLIRTVARGISA
jgi:predicted ATPase/Tfp pilus assembly protein PilF